MDVVQTSSSDRPWFDGSGESAGHQAGHELAAVLAARRAGERAVLPFQKAPGVDHDGHEELTLPLREADRRGERITRLTLTLSNVGLGGYSCVTGTPPCRADAARNDRRHRGADDVDAEAGLGVAGGVSAAVVRREQLDVLVALAAIDLVLDAVVGEVNLAVEVRQVVFARPVTDLVLVAVRSAVAVGAVAVGLLQELLVLALQVLLEDDAPDLEVAVLVSETGLFLAKRRVEVRVVVDLAGAADAGVERLRRLAVSLQRVRIEQVSPLRREGQSALVVAKVNGLDEPSSRRWSRVSWSMSRSCSGTTRKAPTAASVRLSSPFSS